MSSKATLLAHPLAAAKLSILRAKETAPVEFRRAMQDISILLLAEAARAWETKPVQIETPLKKCDGETLRHHVVLVPILRAGLGMLDGMSRLLPEASVGHIGVYRDAETLEPTTYFSRLPSDISNAQMVIVDPMLATGGSACEAVSFLKKGGARRIQFICLVACSAGIERLQSAHPDVAIVTAAIDPELDDSGYIVPGLGDAGDRYFGTA